jgi:hypothetical protein
MVPLNFVRRWLMVTADLVILLLLGHLCRVSVLCSMFEPSKQTARHILTLFWERVLVWVMTRDCS